ncbi:MAG: DUF362 domain-containing protein [Deltaproteobacteria bacterium]|nr:DUF362 domain-containing protein [Deltaproteobacteria bacterium]
MQKSRTPVALLNTADRKGGVGPTIDKLGINPVKGKQVLVKPNFNTADRTPGSTHNDTLVALVKKIWDMGARTVSLGERSYPPTRQVMEQKGVIPLLEKLDVQIIDFDTLPPEDWVKVDVENSHWRDGFRIARPVMESECLVSTGCLKTHQFGGVFTHSLKLHVGVVPTTRNGFDYMTELHGSPHQRQLIAEINAPFKTDLIFMDGVEAFVDGGPATGKKARGDVLLASVDRIAIDAVGIAVLKTLGSNQEIMNTAIFDHDQIARAVELGIGVSAVSDIRVVAVDEKSTALKDRVLKELI